VSKPKGECRASHHPIVRFLYDEARGQAQTFKEIADEAGVSPNMFTHIRNGRVPSVNNVDALLRAMGYRLAIVEADSGERVV
jgi:transcriptional regulator with XRE-family HTH domain